MDSVSDFGSGVLDPALTLLECLVVVARHKGVHLAAEQLRREHLVGRQEPTMAELVRIGKASGLRIEVTRLSWSDLMSLGEALPAIVRLESGDPMVLLNVAPKAEPQHVVLTDPDAPERLALRLDEERFSRGWSGEVILVKRLHALMDGQQPFGIRLILGRLLQDRRIVRDIAMSGFVLGLLAATPILFWRILIDRVLYYKSMDTFAVLCATMAVLIVFETVFGYLKRYLTDMIVRRVDASLSSEIFRRVLNLPIDYFETTPAGVTTRDMNEIYKIRQFVSGQLFGTILEASVLIVFLPIMFFFSGVLTFCVLGMCLVICGWIMFMLPQLHRKTAAVFEAEGRKHAFLVETIQGARTIKSLALDARQRRRWDELVARVADLRFDESRTVNLVQTVMLPLERLLTSGTFALAVYLSITSKDDVYVGALVAFMMLIQRVAAPLIQLSQLLQEYDNARIAVKIVGALVNQAPEVGRSRNGVRAPIEGRVEFQDVRFFYRGANAPALDGVSFTIEQGSIFGIMGRSGSGKTTITRLLQLLHSNYHGQIKVDDHDLRQFDIDHLRGNTGVVLQENFLFSGTVSENIAAARPGATHSEIIRAARLAGAEEFIERLPAGYETFIQEGSTNLSGGQRQRLAIARALIVNPRILVLDEATSALDAESEAIVNANLMRIAAGRTVIIVSHRLSSLVLADQILVLERGKVHDIGRHGELLQRCDVYASLWHQQHRHLLSDQTSV